MLVYQRLGQPGQRSKQHPLVLPAPDSPGKSPDEMGHVHEKIIEWVIAAIAKITKGYPLVNKQFAIEHGHLVR